MRRSAAALGLTVALVLGVQQTARAEAQERTAPPTGLVVLDGPEDPPPAQIPDEAGQLLHKATEMVKDNSADLGYPWFDRSNGSVVIDSATARGNDLIAQFRGSHRFVTPLRGRQVKNSFKSLEKIKNEAIDAPIPDSDAVFMTGPDPDQNRIMIFISRKSDSLLEELAKRYGTEAIAVRYVPGVTSTGDGRDNDTSPFYGGAQISAPAGSCSTGFSWRNSGASMMLTAGHCTPSGGDISTPSEYIGYVSPGSRENWNKGTGTVYLSGQSTYRGDLALAAAASGKATSPLIYRGGPGSYSTAYVGEMWSRRPASGDKYCNGGYKTGEKCNWTVYATGYTFKHSDGEVARNVVRSFWRNDGVCAVGGDSGGPVYTVRSDGKVAAKGIHHGHSSSSVSGCMDVFTDIWEAYYGLPGNLATG